MDIEARIAHLANMVILLDYHQRLGGAVNKWITAEFTEKNNELIEQLKKDHK